MWSVKIEAGFTVAVAMMQQAKFKNISSFSFISILFCRECEYKATLLTGLLFPLQLQFVLSTQW